MYDLIVIGAGPGGYEAAAHAGKMGKKTAVIEQGQVGGICLNLGCIPTKTLLHSARILETCREADDYGIHAENITINFARIRERQQTVVAQLAKGVSALLKQSGVEVISGTARILNRSSVRVGETVYETRNILISTGSRPALPPIAGIESPTVVDSTGMLNVNDIPPSLAVIGASAVGLEFASLFSAFGSKVTVFEMLERIAFQADAEMTGHLLKALLKKGIDFHTGSRVTKIDKNIIYYTDKDKKECSQETSMVLNATGRVPNVADLGLAEAGVFFSPRGINTDDQGRTNVAGIRACGDVTGRMLLAHAATREGIAAVNNMFGRQDVIRYHAVPSVVYTRPELASVGKTEEQLKTDGVAYKKAVVPMSVSGRFLAENEKKQGYVKVLAGSTYNELLGIHILGSHAGEMIYGCAMMLENEMRCEDVAGIVFPHPTVSEAIKEAVNRLCEKK